MNHLADIVGLVGFLFLVGGVAAYDWRVALALAGLLMLCGSIAHALRSE